MPELNGLYAHLGYDPICEEKVNKLLKELLSLRRLEIRDAPRLCQLLDRIRQQKGQTTHGVDSSLLHLLSDAGQDREQIRLSLEKALESQRTFYAFDLHVPSEVWPHLEIHVSNHGKLGEVLDDIERVFDDWGAQSEPIKDEVREVIARTRNVLDSEAARRELPGLCQNLMKCANEAAFETCHHEDEIEARRKKLNDVLRDCLLFRHEFGPEMKVQTIGFRGLCTIVNEAAKSYLEMGWAHSRWLNGYITATVLMAEIAPLAYPQKDPFSRLFDFRRPWYFYSYLALVAWSLYVAPWSWGTWILTGLFVVLGIIVPVVEKCLYHRQGWLQTLWGVCAELDSGAYDNEAVARRLQSWERKGCYVPSVTYSLLRLPIPATAPG